MVIDAVKEVSRRLAGGAVAQTSVLFLALTIPISTALGNILRALPMLVGLFEFFAHMSALCCFTSLKQKVQHA